MRSRTEAERETSAGGSGICRSFSLLSFSKGLWFPGFLGILCYAVLVSSETSRVAVILFFCSGILFLL